MSRAYQSSRLKIPAKPFISTWNTATTYTGSTANNQIRLPLISTGTYKFTVNWGDSTSDNITTWNQAETTLRAISPRILQKQATFLTRKVSGEALNKKQVPPEIPMAEVGIRRTMTTKFILSKRGSIMNQVANEKTKI